VIRVIAGVAVFVLVPWLVGVAVVAAVSGSSFAVTPRASAGDPQAPPSAFAVRDVPARYLDLYLRAARAFGLDWSVLASIGKLECDHGRAPDPSCTRSGATNSAGAGGPMQFLAPTWARYGRDADHDGRADRWDPADAIFAAAAYLRASGAPRDYARAILAYNRSPAYVADVLALAARYRGRSTSIQSADAYLAGASATPVAFIEGDRAQLAPGDPHLALVATLAPSVVQAMVIAGNELQDLPYGPAGHPDPRGATQEDCSSTLNFVLWRSGLRPISEILRANPLAHDYERWGAPGPGRWVTIYASATHAFAVIAGMRLDTSHAGTDLGPNRFEDGPRWRIFNRIPTWAHWSVRHPPGL
jgi:Transglycosylase SLT domain